MKVGMGGKYKENTLSVGLLLSCKNAPPPVHLQWLIGLTYIFVYQKALKQTFFHQLFNYTITFENPQHYNTNSKGDFVLEIGFKHSFKDFWHRKINLKNLV